MIIIIFLFLFTIWLFHVQGDKCGIYGANCPKWVVSMQVSGIARCKFWKTSKLLSHVTQGPSCRIVAFWINMCLLHNFSAHTHLACFELFRFVYFRGLALVLQSAAPWPIRSSIDTYWYMFQQSLQLLRKYRQEKMKRVESYCYS